MDKVAEPETRTQASKKVIATVLVVFTFLAATLFSLARYYRVAKQVINNPLQGQAFDLIRSDQQYREEIGRILDSYLVEAKESTDLAGADFLVATELARNSVMDLKVSASLKTSHLSFVLVLAKVEDGIRNKNIDLINDSLGELENILDSL